MGGRWRRLVALLPNYARTARWGLLGHRGGASPRVVVQAVVLSERGVLLAVRPDLRGWELPGGHPNPGETDREALVREVREETGLEIAVERHTGTYHRTGFLPHEARVFRCRLVGGMLHPSPETPRVAWWNPTRLPETLFPWYRGPLEDALASTSGPVERTEHQGVAAILTGMRIDLRMRWSGDRAH